MENRRGAGRPKGSRALTLLAPTGERMAFYEAARLYDQEALRVIASVMMDDKQPASLRLAAANDLLDRGYGKPPQAVVAHPARGDKFLRFAGSRRTRTIGRSSSNRSRIGRAPATSRRAAIIW